ncbi:MAG: PAS domain-containing sensor histidine kinase [Candidatus Obscuribacterales bacterium]|jgi:PAS domain S-box-containing protein|nr:PAS domain-containing sensor histidine kinase [Candidatus Obscuribacterales bacterium]
MYATLSKDEDCFDFSADELRMLFNESVDIFTITDLQTRKLLKANPAHTKLFGHESRNADDFAQWIHPDDRDYVLEKLRKDSIVGNHISIVECRCLSVKTGEYIWMQWRSTIVPEEGRMYSIGRNIHAQKEAQLRSAQLASLVEFSAEAIIGVGLDKVIRTWNRGASSIFGFSQEEAEGAGLAELFTAESNRKLVKDGLQCQETELECVRKNGQSFFASVTVSDVLDHHQKSTGYVITIRDITERKQVEKRVKEFYSTVSHELRTPLTSILGTLSLISAEHLTLPPELTNELIEIAKESCHRLVRLINEILDIQKIESGKLELAITENCPVELMNKAMNETTAMAEDRGATFRPRCQSNLPKVQADTDKIVQVLTNLISNATKFSESKPIDLSIECTKNEVCFSVRDQGPGIPENQSHKLFGKFQQIDSSDSRKYGGTGLGLAICRNIVELHGGSIGYRNNDDRGCTFWFTLPCASPLDRTTAESSLANPLLQHAIS